MEWPSAGPAGEDSAMPESDPDFDSPPADQPRNPLHGLTLEAMLTALVAHFGWPGLGDRIAVRCFLSDPSIKSSLAFLRRTPWAREKVESLYLFMLREQRRARGPGSPLA
jgi:uncharacterized protein (DUF2132 family)